MREAERRSLFHLIYARTNFSASIEHFRQDLGEGEERAKALLLLALLDIH